MQILLGPVTSLKMRLNGAVKLAHASTRSQSDQGGKEDTNGIKTSSGFENLRLLLMCVCSLGVCVCFVERRLLVVKIKQTKEKTFNRNSEFM